MEAGLSLSEELYAQMRQHVIRCLPEEACGLIGGKAGRAEVVVAVTNALHSSVRFRMEPQEQLEVFQNLEARGLDLLGIYHSHPTGPPYPSETDLTEFAYPGLLTLIWFPDVAGWSAACFLIEDDKFNEIPLTIIGVGA